MEAKVSTGSRVELWQETHRRRPNEFMTSPQRDVLIVAASREKFILRMGCESPKLPSMAENYLIEASLQGALEDVVAGRADVDVAVVAARPLRVNRANAASVFRKLLVEENEKVKCGVKRVKLTLMSVIFL